MDVRQSIRAETSIVRTEKTPTETSLVRIYIVDFGRDIYGYKTEHLCRDVYFNNRETEPS
jgi:hypothetical protein